MVPVHPEASRASGSVSERRRGILAHRGMSCVAATAEPHDATLQTDINGTFADVATWNVCSGRNGGLESALRAMKALSVDICLFTEAKLMDGIHTRVSSRFSVVATDAASKSQGGVALCWREIEAFEVEETTKFGPNVIAFQLVTGEDRFYVVGVYIPPSDLKTLDDVRSAWANCPKNCKPIVLGDININLESPCNERDETIAEEMDFCALSDMSCNFRQRRKRFSSGRWT